ncbi:MAG: CDP-diacylglycerol--glycerol-3-phosphate 3-phosphatidyltransferase [Clostridia bacterium]|nr:CDP-diacylglycerol--glycerol-3-phosphate 3-phosphatidyltransferase [Clostridia bacterium]
MNLPNKLTLTRFVLVIVFAFFAFPLPDVLCPNALVRAWIALIVYIVASITDALDGHLARKNNMVTDFGKFLDPIADKLLVTSALLSLILVDTEGLFHGIYIWSTLIILTREFMVSGVRMIAASKGVVIAAGKMGKLKMIFQTIAIIVLLTVPVFGGMFAEILRLLGDILMIVAVILTIWSGAEYLWKNRTLFMQAK